MWYLLLFIPLAALVFFGLRSKINSPRPGDQMEDPIVKGIDDSIRKYSRAELEAKLAELARTPVPQDSINFGAMCYSVAVRKEPPVVKDNYICPVCGEKTVYKSDERAYHLFRSVLPTCKVQAANIREIDLRIDESQFCKHCSDIESPEIGLITRYDQDTVETKTFGINTEDLHLIREFLDGRLTHDAERGSKLPLKDNKERIAQLLGLTQGGL